MRQKQSDCSPKYPEFAQQEKQYGQQDVWVTDHDNQHKGVPGFEFRDRVKPFLLGDQEQIGIKSLEPLRLGYGNNHALKK